MVKNERTAEQTAAVLPPEELAADKAEETFVQEAPAKRGKKAA